MLRDDFSERINRVIRGFAVFIKSKLTGIFLQNWWLQLHKPIQFHVVSSHTLNVPPSCYSANIDEILLYLYRARNEITQLSISTHAQLQRHRLKFINPYRTNVKNRVSS